LQNVCSATTFVANVVVLQSVFRYKLCMLYAPIWFGG